jgi:hypothetical protein
MKPRLTSKVVRGLGKIAQAITRQDMTALTNASLNSSVNGIHHSDDTAALRWINQTLEWKSTPRRRQPIPKQFRTKRRRR